MPNELLKAIPTINLDILLGYAQEQSITFRFWRDSEFTDPYNLDDAFRFRAYKDKFAATHFLEITEPTLVRSGNSITIPFTVLQTTVEREYSFYRLRNLGTEQEWFIGGLRINKDRIPDGDYSVDQQMNIAGTTVNVQMTTLDLAALSNTEIGELYERLLPYITGEQTP